MKYIPYGRQFINKSDIDLVSSSLKEDLITSGKNVKKFEIFVSLSVQILASSIIVQSI